MRLRIQCKKMLQFGAAMGPCHKILCEVYGGDVVEKDGEVIVRNVEKIIFKCSKCGEKKTIKFDEEGLNDG